AGTSCSAIDQGDRASGQIELSADPDAGAAIKRTVRFPLGGRTALLFRAVVLPEVGVPLKEALADPTALDAAFSGAFRDVALPAPQVVIVSQIADPTDDQREQLVEALGPTNAPLADLIFAVAVEPFDVTDEHSTYFTMDPAMLAADFIADPEAAADWEAF